MINGFIDYDLINRENNAFKIVTPTFNLIYVEKNKQIPESCLIYTRKKRDE